MSGYSKTPLVRKLGIEPGMTLLLLSAPANFDKTLGPIARELKIRRRAQGKADGAILFCGSQAILERRVDSAIRALGERAWLWLAWPKKASGVPTDLSGAEIRRAGLVRGWVDFKVCSIDDSWSGHKFVRRRG